jgi:hypothetical protein
MITGQPVSVAWFYRCVTIYQYCYLPTFWFKEIVEHSELGTVKVSAVASLAGLLEDCA